MIRSSVVQKNVTIRVAAAGIGMILLTSAYYRTQSVPLMVDTAKNFLASLTQEQMAKAVIDFKSDERENWHFIPRERKGLPLREMTSPQKHLAQALLSAGLSQRGYIKATTIMSLEDVLRMLENDSGVRRNPEGYYFSVFGDPAPKGVWGYRVEGHHLSLNFTVVNGKLASSPNFFGTNPAEIRQGPRKGLRVLGREEDLARDLLTALTPDQKKTAIVAKDAYKDIISFNAKSVQFEKEWPAGLAAAKMNAKQREMLDAVLEEYAYNLPEQVAQQRMEQVKKAGANINFAWAGAEQRGGPHYYRIQGPTFLVEYDNTQNDANHVHSVWRDYNGDFGRDLLREHYQTSHH
ncbi:MAG TPA: DUF3500 domain-containing protein [Bryobacteraceae bacterium]|nr:DUF3500 domain-containing protein [Bryobacteraceae bacterium]